MRDGTYFPSLLEPRRRSEKALLAVIQQAYVEGVSTRRVDDLLHIVPTQHLRYWAGVSLREALGLTGIDTPAPAGGARETENRSLLLDAPTPQDLERLVAERMRYYNSERRHSTIGYRAPAAYIATQWQRM